jgi:hypothetical protein
VNHAFITLHIDNLRGENAHHQAETVFKAVARALRMALDIDHTIESHGSPDKRAFMDVARERGMRLAIAWRDARFAKAQDGGGA